MASEQGESGGPRRFGLRFPEGSEAYRRAWAYWIGWATSRALALGYFGCRAAGWERVPPNGPLIFAANHASYFDPPLVGACCARPISYFGRESLFSNRLGNWILRSVGAVPLDRDGASGKGLKTIIDRLQSGDAIILFPEGTRTRDGALQPARAGIGLIALKSGAPVVPVRVFGTYEAFGRHRRWPRPRRVAVHYGEPLRFEAQRAESATADRARVKVLYQEVADAIMAAIQGLERP